LSSSEKSLSLSADNNAVVKESLPCHPRPCELAPATPGSLVRHGSRFPARSHVSADQRPRRLFGRLPTIVTGRSSARFDPDRAGMGRASGRSCLPPHLVGVVGEQQTLADVRE